MEKEEDKEDSKEMMKETRKKKEAEEDKKDSKVMIRNKSIYEIKYYYFQGGVRRWRIIIA